MLIEEARSGIGFCSDEEQKPYPILFKRLSKHMNIENTRHLISHHLAINFVKVVLQRLKMLLHNLGRHSVEQLDGGLVWACLYAAGSIRWTC